MLECLNAKILSYRF